MPDIAGEGHVMADGADGIELEGIEALFMSLDELADDSIELRTAELTAAGQVILDLANQMAPKPVIVMAVKETKGSVIAKIGPDKDHWHYRFIERGVARHDISGNPWLYFEGQIGPIRAKAVRQAGGMAARPFLRPALMQGKEAAIMAAWRVRLAKAKKDD